MRKLGERQGICHWDPDNANCVTAATKPCQLQSIGSADGEQGYNGNNGYDQLPEPYLTYYKIALRFAHKSFLDDRQDLLHDIIEGLARVAEHKTIGEAAMYRLAEHVKDHYWYKHYAYHNGLDCQHCSKEQRAKCRYRWGHSEWGFADCEKAIRLESLNQPVTDSEGNMTELGELIADDNALDLDEWLDAKSFLIGAPIRLKAIAIKKHKGQTLTEAELMYLSRLRKKQQKTLASVRF
jgi:hypothetical protein